MAYIWELPGWNSGTRIRRSCWYRGEYTQKLKDKWYNEVKISAMEHNDWELYVEPPTEVEVEVFEWMYLASPLGWFIVDKLRTEEEAAEYFRSTPYRKTGRSFRVPVTGKGNSK